MENDETTNNTKKSLKYFILGIVKPHVKRALNFSEIITANILANKPENKIEMEGMGKDQITGIPQKIVCQNILKLSEHPDYETIFLGFFIDNIKNFKELYKAELKFLFEDLKDKDKKVIEKRNLQTTIYFIATDGARRYQKFRTDF